jgi:lysozyme family protein
MRYGAKWPDYAKQWDTMVIKPARAHEFDALAKFAIDPNHKSRYQEIELATGVPWWLIAVLHRRESDADFNTYLGNGDRLSHATVNVPVGRGPFTGPKAFFDGAKDALHLDGLDAVRDWRIEKALYYCEIFNGTGYDRHGRPSPYVWGGTNIQVIGKYVRDGVWDSGVWDGQPGCAPILKTLGDLDPSIQFVRES